MAVTFAPTQEIPPDNGVNTNETQNPDEIIRVSLYICVWKQSSPLKFLKTWTNKITFLIN